MHVAGIFVDTARACWLKQDLFADILVDHAERDMLVIDLDDVGTGPDLGLLTPPQASSVLRTTNAAVRAIENGDFPFPAVRRGQAACKELGW
jgi:predicted RNA-binding protein associated with RNAse of E/G family